MKKFRYIIVLLLVTILVGCSGPGESKSDASEVPVQYVGTLVSFSEQEKQEIVKKEIVSTPYVSIIIEDEFGGRQEVHYYDNMVNIDDLVMGSTLTLTANEVTTTSGDLVVTENVGTDFVVDHIPLELVIGMTSYELMNQVHDWHYKEIHTETTVEGIMSSGGRTMDYAFTDMVTKESDGYVFHSVETMSETVDLVTQNESIVIFSDLDDDISYMNINYEEWELLDKGTIIDTNVDIVQGDGTYVETAYYEESGRYIVEGESADFDEGYVSGLIMNVIDSYEYDEDNLSYTFKAVFDATNQQLIFIDYDVIYDGPLSCPTDNLTINKFNILISCIDSNNIDTVPMPAYIEASIAERNRPKFLCEVFYDITPDKVTDRWLTITFDIPEEEEVEDDFLGIGWPDEDESEEGEEGEEQSEPATPQRDREALLAYYREALTTVTTETFAEYYAAVNFSVPEEKEVADMMKGFADIYGISSTLSSASTDDTVMEE